VIDTIYHLNFLVVNLVRIQNVRRQALGIDFEVTFIFESDDLVIVEALEEVRFIVADFFVLFGQVEILCSDDRVMLPHLRGIFWLLWCFIFHPVQLYLNIF